MKIDEQWWEYNIYAEPYARQKMMARTVGEKGRHLRPRLVQKIAEGKTSYELG